MDELISGLISKVGLDKATAEKVVGFLKENATKVPQWLGSSDAAKGIAEKVGLGSLLGK